MSKIGIVGNGFCHTMLLIAETKGNEITAKQLNELAARSKELGQTYTITERPELSPIPDIYMEDTSFGVNKHKIRSYTESDNRAYNKKISKRRKKNKNKKTHRK